MIARLTRRLLLFGAISLLLSGVVRAQDAGVWQAAQGPVALITHIASDPNAPDFLFLFISNSVQRNPDQTQTIQGRPSSSWAPYFSVDGGEHWQPASNDLAGLQPTTLKIFSHRGRSSIWVGTAENGLWRSDNGGRTWRPALIPGMSGQTIIDMAQDARHRLHLLTIDNSRQPATHLYTSDDGGYRWQHRQLQSYSADASVRPTGIVADPFDGNRLYIATQGGLLVTPSAGFNWKRVSLPLPEGADPQGTVVLATDPTQRGRVYLARRTRMADGSRQLQFFLSLNSGDSWKLLPASFSLLAGANPDADPTPVSLSVDPLARQQLLLATNCGLWLSPDGGVSWRSAGTDLSGVSLRGVLFHPRHRGTWIAAGAGGIWRTRSSGSVWESIQRGLPPASSIRQLYAFPGRHKTLLALNGGFLPGDDMTQPLWRSEDGGASWLPARRGLEGVHLRQLIPYPHDPAVAFALTDEGIARTDNSGHSWLHRPLDAYPLALAADPTGPNIYLATAAGLQRSTDKGDSWTSVYHRGVVVAVTVNARGDVFLAAYGANGNLTLWQSQDAGGTWQEVGDLPVQGAITLYAHPHEAKLMALTAPWEGLLVSTDSGKTWSRRDRGIPIATRWRGGAPETPDAPNILTLFMDPESGLWWASRDGGGVYRSVNNGAMWEDVTGDIGDTLILSFARGPEDVVAGTSNLGVLWRRPEPAPATPPEDVDVRIEIFWPHDFAPVTKAQQANLGLRMYRDHSLEPPPCAWSPNVDIMVGRDAEPLHRIDLADHRNVDGHPFPFWMMNDLDVSWANDPEHQLIYMARVSPGLAQSHNSVWIHAADARTRLPDPPLPTGVASAGVTEMDGRILVVWPHDKAGRYAPPAEANLVNISAALYPRGAQLALHPDDLPARLWLIGALDNQIGRRLAVGKPRQIDGDGFRYTLYDFNDIDVSLARDPTHHWTFWLEAPEADMDSNVWVHGSDARTLAPHMTEPIVGCSP
jgi:photosystem II stability/assembly factor-like uncharacterized protein